MLCTFDLRYSPFTSSGPLPRLARSLARAGSALLGLLLAAIPAQAQFVYVRDQPKAGFAGKNAIRGYSIGTPGAC